MSTLDLRPSDNKNLPKENVPNQENWKPSPKNGLGQKQTKNIWISQLIHSTAYASSLKPRQHFRKYALG